MYIIQVLINHMSLYLVQIQMKTENIDGRARSASQESAFSAHSVASRIVGSSTALHFSVAIPVREFIGVIA